MVHVSMHRQIMDGYISSELPEVDHIDGNRLDNRRQNLRVVTVKHNRQNRRRHSNNKSGHKGVIWYRGMWQAQIRIDGNLLRIGRFHAISEAADAYQREANRIFGEFNRPNQ